MVPKPHLPSASAPEEALTGHFSSSSGGTSQESLEYTPPKIAEELPGYASKVRPKHVYKELIISPSRPLIVKPVHESMDEKHGLNVHFDHHMDGMGGGRESDKPRPFQYGFPRQPLRNQERKGRQMFSESKHDELIEILEYIEKQREIDIITNAPENIDEQVILLEEENAGANSAKIGVDNDLENKPPPEEPNAPKSIDSKVTQTENLSLEKSKKSETNEQSQDSQIKPKSDQIAETSSPSSNQQKKRGKPISSAEPLLPPADGAGLQVPQGLQGKNPTDSGILQNPGHDLDAPADLNLVHHDRSPDALSDSGIIVRDESTNISADGATALILAGTCSLLLVFICFIMFVNKVRRQRIEKKVDKTNDDSLYNQITPIPTNQSFDVSAPKPPLSLLQVLSQPQYGSTALQKLTALKNDSTLASYLALQSGPGDSRIGRIWFSVFYNFEESVLHLHILHSRYSNGRGVSSNPGEVWVEVSVLTSLNKLKAQLRTDKRKATQSPVFNHKFTFQMESSEVDQCILRMSLMDQHPQKGTHSVGSVILPLTSVDLNSKTTISRDVQ